MSNGINRIIGLVLLNGETLSGSVPAVIRFVFGRPNKYLNRESLSGRAKEFTRLAAYI